MTYVYHKDVTSGDLHTPKAHTLDSHSEKKLDTLGEKTADAGVTVDTCLIKDGKAADSNKLEGSTKAQVIDPALLKAGGTMTGLLTLDNTGGEEEGVVLSNVESGHVWNYALSVTYEVLC